MLPIGRAFVMPARKVFVAPALLQEKTNALPPVARQVRSSGSPLSSRGRMSKAWHADPAWYAAATMASVVAPQTTASVVSASVKFAAQKASCSATAAYAVATLPQSVLLAPVAQMALFSATTACAVAILPQSVLLAPAAQRALFSATTRAPGEAMMASGAWVATRTRMSIQACVAMAAEAMTVEAMTVETMTDSCSASAVRVELIPAARAAGIASAMPMSILDHEAAAAVARMASSSEKAVFAVAIQMSTMAAHAHVELVP